MVPVALRPAREVFSLTSIGGQGDRRGNRLHRSEIVARPLVSNDAGDTNNAILLSAAESVPECGGPNQVEDLVDSPRTDFPDPFGDRPSVDEYLIDTAFAQQLLTVGVASC